MTDLAVALRPGPVREWLVAYVNTVLNVAGPRESRSPGLQEKAAAYRRRVLAGG